MSQATSLAGLNVLVVEDEMTISLLIEDILVDQLCRVVGPFHRVASALRATQVEAIDLAVLDINIAGERVFPIAEALAKRNIPFLLLSGYGQSAVPAEHPEWRACSKPFKPEELVSMLKEQAGLRGI